MRPASATTGVLPTLPRIIFPACPITVDAFAPGMSPYAISASTSMASMTLPRPEPSTTPTRGLMEERERTNETASLIFIAVAVVVYQIGKRMSGGKRGLLIAFGVFTVAIFVAFNLLAFLFENLKEVVNKLIAYTGEGSKFVFGVLGDQTNKSIGF